MEEIKYYEGYRTMKKCINTQGERIKRIRIKRGISRKELAEKMEVSIRTIEAWEQGRRPIKNIERLKKLKTILNVSLENII